MALKYTLAWSKVTAWNSSSTDRFWIDIWEWIASISGILKFNPGVNMRRYLPNTVTTAIVPCFTVTKDEKIMINKIKTKINEVIEAAMTNNI